MNQQHTTPPPPEHLGPAGRDLWTKTLEDFSPDDFKAHSFELLAAAGTQLDRAAQARAAIEKHGIATKDRFNQLRENPAVAVERNAHLAFVRIARELGLDLEPPSESRGPQRPGTSR
jgi:phage terminase small subunit